MDSASPIAIRTAGTPRGPTGTNTFFAMAKTFGFGDEPAAEYRSAVPRRGAGDHGTSLARRYGPPLAA
jgi:hypothetical protein